MDYTVVRSRRSTMALEITRDARVLVRAPYRTADAALRRVVDAHQQWIDTHLTRRQDYLASHPAPTEAEIAALRERAKTYLPGRVAFWAERMGVAPSGVKITSARTRFGSCSG